MGRTQQGNIVLFVLPMFLVLATLVAFVISNETLLFQMAGTIAHGKKSDVRELNKKLTNAITQIDVCNTNKQDAACLLRSGPLYDVSSLEEIYSPCGTESDTPFLSPYKDDLVSARTCINPTAPKAISTYHANVSADQLVLSGNSVVFCVLGAISIRKLVVTKNISIISLGSIQIETVKVEAPFYLTLISARKISIGHSSGSFETKSLPNTREFTSAYLPRLDGFVWAR